MFPTFFTSNKHFKERKIRILNFSIFSWRSFWEYFADLNVFGNYAEKGVTPDFDNFEMYYQGHHPE